MFTGISRLLKFLRKSFEIQYSPNRTSRTSNQDEHQFQTAVINGIGMYHIILHEKLKLDSEKCSK